MAFSMPITEPDLLTLCLVLVILQQSGWICFTLIDTSFPYSLPPFLLSSYSAIVTAFFPKIIRNKPFLSPYLMKCSASYYIFKAVVMSLHSTIHSIAVNPPLQYCGGMYRSQDDEHAEGIDCLVCNFTTGELHCSV